LEAQQPSFLGGWGRRIHLAPARAGGEVPPGRVAQQRRGEGAPRNP